MSDENARRLREDLSAMDRLVHMLRTQLHRLVTYITDHMLDVHDETFDPADVYGDDDA